MEQRFVFPWGERASQGRRFALPKIHPFALFFTADGALDKQPLIDVQRRACWITLALVLQALNEIDPRVYLPSVPFLRPWGSVVSFTLIMGSFFMMWMAFRPTALRQPTTHTVTRLFFWQRLRRQPATTLSSTRKPHVLQYIVLILALLTAFGGVFEFGRTVKISLFDAPLYTNDGTSLDANAAVLLLHGRNPYTDSKISQIAQAFALDPSWTTPLRAGQFANRLNYPSINELRSALDTDIKSGQAPEFESKVSYPSLSFLTLVPFIWLGIANVLPFYLFCYVALVALGWSAARKELRPWIIVFALANISMWASVMGGNLDVLTILFLVMAWLWREHRWRSALTLGLALACKQPAWFFVPFYAILMLQTYGWKEAVRRLTITAAVFLLLNFPFILWDAPAWFAGIMAPVSDPMFPMGVGIVGLVGSPFLHSYMSSTTYSLLEYGIFYPLCIAWYWRLCKQHPEAVMLLAVLPLFFAWRSLPSYFACAAFPMFLLLAARNNTDGDTKSQRESLLPHPPAMSAYRNTSPSLSDPQPVAGSQPVAAR